MIWRGRLGVAVAALMLVVGCAGSRPKPTPLEPLKPAISGRQVWTQRIEGVPFPLLVAVNGDRFTVAAGDGSVLSLNAGPERVAPKIFRVICGLSILAAL